jgi:flagellar L-ring protein precursor FlgH
MASKRRFVAVFAALFLVILYAGLALADDVVRDDGDINSIYTDHKAVKAGDIVTILIIESTSGAQSASLTTQKQQSLQGGMGTMTSWGNGTSLSVPSWGAGGQENQNGSGESERSGSLTAKLSATVEKVLSNGNLMIKGTKVVKINDENENLIITGVIRPEDIASDNTISSTNVAEANIKYEGTGPIGEKVSPGILTRLLDWLGIF